MVLNYYGKSISPDGIYRFLPPKTKKQFTSIGELMQASRSNGVPNEYKKHGSQEEALATLRASLEEGRPVICLVKYDPWRKKTKNDFKWGHFVVATGYDDNHILMNDPIFGLWVKPDSKGDHYEMTVAEFCAGWGGFPYTENPNWACILFNREAPAPVEITEPGPSPEPTPAPTTPEPEPEPEPQPEPEPEPEPELEPEFGDTEYDEHVVVAGESLSALANRYYGNPGNWRVIQRFNHLRRESIWVGETLRIPRLDDNGLLSFGVSFGISFDAVLSDDVQEDAFDYNDIGESSAGMGFLDE